MIMADSIELMIGKLQGTMESVKDDVAILSKEVKSLPCATNTQMITTLNNWKRDCNGASQMKIIESYKGGISLKNGIIILILTVAITNGSTLLISLLTRGG